MCLFDDEINTKMVIIVKGDVEEFRFTFWRRKHKFTEYKEENLTEKTDLFRDTVELHVRTKAAFIFCSCRLQQPALSLTLYAFTPSESSGMKYRPVRPWKGMGELGKWVVNR